MVVIDKFESVRALLNEHNEVVGLDSLGFIDPEVFLNKVKQSGGTSDDRLKGFSHEEILDLLGLAAPKNDTKPFAIAKSIAKIFRGKDDVAVVSPQYVSSKKAEKMSLQELVSNFDPEEFNSPVAERLKKLTKNQPFIVYSSGRIVDAIKTLELLNEIKKGFEGRKTIIVDGVPAKVYPIGELPDEFVDENPIYFGRPLRPDGTCDQLNRSWQGVSKEIRQFVRLAIELKETAIDLDKAHALLDMCLTPNALVSLRQRYVKTSIEFDNRQKLGTLPLLLVTLATSVTSDPFAGGKEVAWVPKNVYVERTTRPYNNPNGYGYTGMNKSLGYYDPHNNKDFIAVNKTDWQQMWKK